MSRLRGRLQGIEKRMGKKSRRQVFFSIRDVCKESDLEMQIDEFKSIYGSTTNCLFVGLRQFKGSRYDDMDYDEFISLLRSLQDPNHDGWNWWRTEQLA